jgi:hypothetical protein
MNRRLSSVIRRRVVFGAFFVMSHDIAENGPQDPKKWYRKTRLAILPNL